MSNLVHQTFDCKIVLDFSTEGYDDFWHPLAYR